jgi:hypothetical protein
MWALHKGTTAHPHEKKKKKKTIALSEMFIQLKHIKSVCATRET